MREPIQVLIVDNEMPLIESLLGPLRRRGFQVQWATIGQTALERIEFGSIQVVLLDLRMPGMDGHELLRRIKRLQPDVQVIIFSGHGSIPAAVDCTKAGAFCFLEKPVDTEVVAAAIEEAHCHQQFHC